VVVRPCQQRTHPQSRRPQSGGDGSGRDDEGIDRLLMSPQAQWAPLPLSHEVIGDSSCDEQLTPGGVLLHPRRDIDRITEGSEVNHRIPNVAHVRDARIDRYTYLHPRPLVAAVTDGFEQLHPRHNRPPSVMGTTNASNKESHDLIADELVDHGVMPKKGLRHSGVEAVEQHGEVGGNAALADCRRAANVGESRQTPRRLTEHLSAPAPRTGVPI
jgi:hypothetical protein